jgi:hypothetical protein
MSASINEHDLKPLPLEACGLALSWSLALFGAWAWLLAGGALTGELTMASAGYILLAVLCVVVQIASNYAAAAARRARALKLPGSHAWAVRLMMAGGAFNAFNAHHAWETTGLVPPIWPMSPEAFMANLPVLALSIVLAMYEPALYWIDEALKGEASARKALADEDALNQARARDQGPRPAEDNVETLDAQRRRSGRRALGGAAAAILMAAGGSAALPPPAHANAADTTRPVDRPVRPADPVARAKAEERALAMLMDGDWSHRAIERETGLHRDTIKRLAATIERAETIAA